MDERAFTDRALSIERRLYRVSRTLLRSDEDCRDAVQEVLLKAWRMRASLREEKYFDTWLTRIVINECRNLYRARRLTLVPAALAESVPDPGAEMPDPPDARVLRALNRLPDKLRLAVELHHIEQLGVAEIAAILRVPAGTVKWRLHQGRAQLRRYLEEEGITHEEE